MKKAMTFILIVVMIVLILGFSSQSGDISNEISKGLSKNIEIFLFGYKSYGYDAEKINFVIRKLAHFNEYLVVSVLMMTALLNIIKRVVPTMLLTGVFGIGLAYFDEKFQANSISRSCSLFDVMLDSAGVIMGILSLTLFIVLSPYIFQNEKLR